MNNVTEGKTRGFKREQNAKKFPEFRYERMCVDNSLAKLFNHVQRMSTFAKMPGYSWCLHQGPALFSRQR